MFRLLILYVLVYIPDCYSYKGADHSNWALLPDSCGIGRDNMRIIGGKTAYLGQFPWMAQVGYRSNGQIVFACGGSLINEYYVISAAHCFEDAAARTFEVVRLGEFDVNSTADCEGPVCAPPVQDIVPEYVTVPVGYVGYPHFKHDIALIRLRWKAKFNEFVQPICLPKGAILNSNFTIYGSVDVAGWGINDSYTQKVPDKLLYVSLNVTDLKKCSLVYGKTFDGQLCIGEGGGKDSCVGDSGGPVMKQYRINRQRRYVLLGLVSYGEEFCGEAPAVYTKISFYVKWILDNLKI